jgi:putative ABC transport system permease protein
MPAFRVLIARARGLFRRQPDPASDDEIDAHIALLTERYVRQGMTPSDAARAARRQFGNSTSLREERAEIQTFAALENLGHDLRYGVRILARNPGFAAVAFLTLALGIGANTAIFSMVEALLVKPLPYADASRLVVPATIFRRGNSDTGSVSYADIADWKAERELFDAVAAYAPNDLDVAGGDEPERIHAIAADEDYFRVMGAPLLLGRSPSAEENHFGAHRVVVLAYGFWMRRFGGDPAAIGLTIELNGAPYRVVGVARKNATWPAEAELFSPRAVDKITKKKSHPPSVL